MKRFAITMMATAMILAAAATAAFAQSSGNFSATGTGASCRIGDGGTLEGGTPQTVFRAEISTSNANGVTLNIRPSLVTGLFTETKISTTIPSASADVGIQVCVTVDGSGAGVLPASCVVYDQRFQQISSNLFSQLSECTSAPTTTVCTVDADCAELGVGFTCDTTAGVCVGPNPDCDFSLILSTLSARSFDFVVPVSKGRPHVVEATWSVIGSGAAAPSKVASCVGPGIVTVTQYKVFNNSGDLLSF